MYSRKKTLDRYLFSSSCLMVCHLNQVFSSRYLPTLVIKLLMDQSVWQKHHLLPSRFHQLQWLSQQVCGLPTIFMVACNLQIGPNGVVCNRSNIHSPPQPFLNGKTHQAGLNHQNDRTKGKKQKQRMIEVAVERSIWVIDFPFEKHFLPLDFL